MPKLMSKQFVFLNVMYSKLCLRCTESTIAQFNAHTINLFFLSFFLSAGLPVVFLAVWQRVDSDTGNVGPSWSERVRAPLESSPCPSGRTLTRDPHFAHFKVFAHACISLLMSNNFNSVSPFRFCYLLLPCFSPVSLYLF